MSARHLCPTCRREVKPTHGQTIPRHLDSAMIAACLSGGEPFYTTVDATPDIRDVRSTLTFPERYSELRYDMELPIWQVAKQLNYSIATLYRMLLRHNMTVPTELIKLVADERKASSTSILTHGR